MKKMNSSQDKQIASMFSKISPWYDFLNHFLSLGIDIYWRKELIKVISSTCSITQPVFLDLATGTMDVMISLEKKFRQLRPTLIGVDLSYEMLKSGLKKTKKLSSKIAVCANGKKLPIRSSSIDVATIAFGIRNVNPREELYNEVLRVLKPGGSFFILEFSPPTKKIIFGLYNFYLSSILPFLGNVISGDNKAYTYLRDSILQFPSPFQLKQELIHSGFSNVIYYPLTYGIVYLHKAKK